MKSTYYIQHDSYCAVIADLTPPEGFHPTWWYVNRIHVLDKYQHQGYGTRIMKWITQDADLEKVTLCLEINAYGALSHEQLEEWYRKYGFEYNADLVSVMVRHPR